MYDMNPTSPVLLGTFVAYQPPRLLLSFSFHTTHTITNTPPYVIDEAICFGS